MDLVATEIQVQGKLLFSTFLPFFVNPFFWSKLSKILYKNEGGVGAQNLYGKDVPMKHVIIK